MRGVLRRILDEDWIVVIACGIALGYVTLDLARTLGNMATSAVVRARVDNESPDSFPDSFFGPSVGAFEGDLYQLLGSVVSFLVVLALVAVVARALPRRGDEPE
jgi:hypothetical protein